MARTPIKIDIGAIYSEPVGIPKVHDSIDVKKGFQNIQACIPRAYL